MGKAGRIARNTLRKEFLGPFVGTFIAFLGVPATLITLLGGHFSLRVTSGLVLFSLTVSGLINKRRWRTPWSIQHILPGGKMIRCPCNLDLARRAAKLAGYEFGRNTISTSNYEPLRAKNRYILSCLIGAKGDFLGYFDVFPLKKNFAELFLQGRVSERDLTHENIYSGREMRRSKYLYIAGIAACDSDSQAGSVNATILIWGLLKYLDYFFGHSEAYIFASAASSDGERVLQSLKIPLICEAATRNDKQRVYGVRLSPERIADRLASVPDYTLLCSLDWAPTKNSIEITPIPRRPSLPRRKRRLIAV